jgi:phytanoyl-CoA hydroxylase
MNSISDASIRHYVDEGFLVVPGLVDVKEVLELCAEAERFARGEYPLSNPPDLPSDASAEDARRSILAVHFPHWVSPVSRAVINHAGIAAVVRKITGAHLPHWDGSAKAMQTMLFLKPPGLQGQAWHQDERFIPTRDRSLMGAWIALDDADEENGCLRVLPRSHRPGVLHPTRPHSQTQEFDVSDEAYGFDASGEIAVAVRAGDVVFFNGYLLHRSMRNRSDARYRRAFVTHYMSAASHLPWMMDVGGDVAMADNSRLVIAVGDDPGPAEGQLPSQSFVRPAEGSWADSGA